MSILVDPLILINPHRCLHINFTFHSSENIMTSGSIFQNRLIFGTFAEENHTSTYFDFTSDKWIQESQNWNTIFRLLMFIILNYVVIIFSILLALIHLCTNLNAKRKALWVKVQEPAWSDFETLVWKTFISMFLRTTRTCFQTKLEFRIKSCSRFLKK